MKTQGNKNGTNTVRPQQQQKNKQNNQHQKPKQQQKQHKMPTKGGVKIGDNTDKSKWRCKTCKFLNDIKSNQCTTCGDPRPGFKVQKKQKKEQQNQQENQCLKQQEK